MNEWADLLKSYYSPHEKKHFVALIKEFMRLSRKGHAQGLLALEDEISVIDRFLFQKGLELILKGTHPDDVRSILTGYMTAKNYSNSELLEQSVIREGLLLLQSGTGSTTILEKLLVIFGEGFFKDVEPITWEEEYNFFLQTGQEEEKPVVNENKQFEDLLFSIQDRKKLEYLIRRVGYFNMGVALKNSSKKLRQHLFSKLSRVYRTELNDEINRVGPCRLQECVDAKKKIASFL